MVEGAVKEPEAVGSSETAWEGRPTGPGGGSPLWQAAAAATRDVGC